jgi:hypothetical protein
MSDYEKAKAKHDKLVARYNREYLEGRWSTNRPLAGKCENAYAEMIEAAEREGIVHAT